MSTELQTTIRELESRRFRAMCEGDIATLDSLLGDSLVYTHSSASTDSKASYMAAFRAKKWIYQRVERPVEEIQVFGDFAVVTGRAEIEVSIDGRPRRLNSRYTDVWVKGQNGWRMVAWQSTPIPAQQGT